MLILAKQAFFNILATSIDNYHSPFCEIIQPAVYIDFVYHISEDILQCCTQQLWQILSFTLHNFVNNLIQLSDLRHLLACGCLQNVTYGMTDMICWLYNTQQQQLRPILLRALTLRGWNMSMNLFFVLVLTPSDASSSVTVCKANKIS